MAWIIAGVAMTSSKPTRFPSGWTLIELIGVMLIVAILVKFARDSFDSQLSGSKSEMTQQRLEAIRTGILGADLSQTTEGVRANFGFIGDIGRLPTSLGELSSQGGLPAWIYSTSYGIGVGWRGPYVSGGDSLSLSIQKDGWGRAIVYSTTLPQPFLSSLGADGAAGGAAANTDLVVEMATSLWQSRLSGNLREGDGLVSGAVVALDYPVAGSLASVLTTSDSNGFFQFNSIPFGVRSLRVVSPTAYGPVPIVVQRGEIQVPDSALNYRGGSESVAYQAGSVKNYNSGLSILAHLSSSYSFPVQLASIKVTWVGGGTFSAVALDGISETFSSAVSSATDKAIGGTMILPAKSSDNSLEITFSGDMTGKLITIVLSWLNRTRTDTVAFTP